MRALLPLTLALLLVLPVVLPAPARAGSLAGVTMADTVQVGGETLRLNGMALRKKLFIKVYVAGLYLPSAETSGNAVLRADTPRRTVLEFLYDVDKEKICEAWDEGLAANTPKASKELQGQFETLCSWMADVEEGDQYVFTYVPGKGTTVEVKGRDRGTIPGKAFADALWASWIGAEPGPGEDFKKDLLGG